MKENIYGSNKRLRFIHDAIEHYRSQTNKKPTDLKILDVGCGTGRYITISLGEKKYNVLGIDIDEPSLLMAKKINPYKNVHFAHFPPYFFPLEKFDIIICSEVLEHVEYPERLMKCLVECMNPNSFLILTTPNGYGWFELDNFLYKKIKFRRLIDAIVWVYWHCGIKCFRDKFRHKYAQSDIFDVPNTLKQNDIHLQYFTLRKLHKIFQRVGLNVIKKNGGSVLCGPITASFLGQCKSFISFNIWLADKLPLSCVSGWYFLLGKT